MKKHAHREAKLLVRKVRLVLPSELPDLPRGQWSAISSKGDVLATGDTVAEVIARAREKGENSPVVTGNLSSPRV